VSERVGAAGWLVLTALVLSACQAAPVIPAVGTYELRSLRDDPVVLAGRCVTAIYDHDVRHGTSILLSDLPVESLLTGDFVRGQVLHIELLWVPKPGTTPIDDTATNASFRHIVFADGEVGLYGGSGFIMPADEIGDAKLSVELRRGSMTLLEATDGFNDLLSPAGLDGGFTATFEPERTRRLYYNISQQVTDAFGYSRFVSTDPTRRLGPV
jgi:hypothetical protein